MIRNDIRVLRQNREQHLQTIGLRSAEVSEWGKNWNNLRARAKRVERECTLTFEEYTTLAAEAGLSSASQIGLRFGDYQLGRKEDRGHYVMGNCRFIVKEQNLKERWLYGGYRKNN
jgi:hypothetical protein